MRLLLDVNVVLDLVLARHPWAGEAARLLTLLERGEHEGYVAGHTVTTVHYLVTRAHDRRTAAVAVADLLDITRVAPVGGNELRRALLLDLPDFEDAVQAACALAVDADAIVSRDPAGFKGVSLPVLPAGAAL